MDKIVWNEGFSVGIKEIDSQHKNLIKMINHLIDAQGADVKSDRIAELLDQMTQYTDYHFKTEEKMMAQFDYPDLDSHKEEHDKFIEKTISFSMQVMAENKTIPAQMLSFLSKWLTGHILEIDMKFKDFFAGKIA